MTTPVALDPSPGAGGSEPSAPGMSRFDSIRRRIGGCAALPAGFIAWALVGAHVSPEGARLTGIVVCVLILWMSEALPLPVSAVLGAAMCVSLAVADARTVFTPFADPIIFLFTGSFVLARAMSVHNLDRRFALAILSMRWAGGNPTRVMAAMGLVTALCSMWISNTATAAMMLPIALGLLRALQALRSPDAPPGTWPFATGMMLMVGYAASVGGIGTPVASPANMIALAHLRELAGVEISFVKWMIATIPIAMVMFCVLFLLMRRIHPVGKLTATGHAELAERLREWRAREGPWTVGQRNTLLAFALVVTLWVGPGLLALVIGAEHDVVLFLKARFPEGVTALLGAGLLFLMPVDARRGRFTLTWADAREIDWGTVVLVGGGLSLGSLLFSTGVADTLGRSVIGATGANSLWMLTAVSIAMATTLSETTSNTATANMVIPVVVALALEAGVNPIPPTLGATLGACFGFLMPVSTPTNAVVYGSGLIPISAMVRAGFWLDLAGFLVILAGLRLICPLLGWV